MARSFHDSVRELCLWLPEAEEFTSHGSPNYRVRGKTFATYAVNHHGDGRVALWLNSSREAQEQYVAAQPGHFFVPPYVGPRGWLGVILDRGVDWQRVAELVREAYEKVAPAELQQRIGNTPAFKAPAKPPAASEVDPLKSPKALAVIVKLRRLCLSLPESSEGTQFGYPVWRAGTKTFALARRDEQGLTLNFWVGVDTQVLMISDPRYRIPPYMGHNGWIALDVESGCDWTEIEALATASYRHFALKRMLAQLPE